MTSLFFARVVRRRPMLFVYMKLLRWSFFSIYCLLFSFDGSEFPHPNHGLKFLALDAKMVATEATFTMCECWKQNAFEILMVPSSKNYPNLKLLIEKFSRSCQSFLLIILLAKWVYILVFYNNIPIIPNQHHKKAKMIYKKLTTFRCVSMGFTLFSHLKRWFKHLH